MSPNGSSVGQALREGWFWAGVFRDHATFIHDGLAPQEREAAELAAAFQRRFATLHDEAESLAQSLGIEGPAGSYAALGAARPILPQGGGQTQPEVRVLNQRLVDTLQALKEFKAELLQRKLTCEIALNMGPSLLQHMINEAEEGYRVLTGLREAANLPPPLESLHHHLLWLPDAAGHAAALHGGLDGTEEQLLRTTHRFKQIFTGMEIKAIELYAMLRVAPRMVGALRRLNRDAVGEIALFRAFLTELREHLEGCEVLAAGLTPLFADHMLREELYYTEKLLEQAE